MNGGYNDWRALFWSASGRVSRGPWWIAIVVLVTLSVLYEGLSAPAVRLATFWFVYPALIYSAVCVNSKRLHDRGRSGWWALMTLLAFAAVWPAVHPVAAVVAAPALVWTLVELGLLGGEQGPNRFGPSPVIV